MSYRVTRTSIKWILPLVLVAPVLAVALAKTWLAHTTGTRSVDDLANQNIQQIHARIEEHLQQLLSKPPAVNTLIKRRLTSGKYSISWLSFFLTTGMMSSVS
ncbi:hypothetical protein ACFL6U_25695 [Planctomycetota bacterium]